MKPSEQKPRTCHLFFTLNRSTIQVKCNQSSYSNRKPWSRTGH